MKKFRQRIKAYNIGKEKLKKYGDFAMWASMDTRKGFTTALVDLSPQPNHESGYICEIEPHKFTEDMDILEAIPELKVHLIKRGVITSSNVNH